MYGATELHVSVKNFYFMKAWYKRTSKIYEEAVSRKLKLWRKWTESRKIVDKHKYDHCATKCKHNVDTYKAEREMNLTDCHDLGKFFEFVNEKLPIAKIYHLLTVQMAWVPLRKPIPLMITLPACSH